MYQMLMLMVVLSVGPVSRDEHVTSQVILAKTEFRGAVWDRTVDAPWLVANANRTVTDSSCNPLATFANTTLLNVTPVLEYGYGIKSLHDVVIGVVNRTLSLSTRGVSILSDTFSDSGTMFMATLAKINQSIYSLGSRIKSSVLDLVGKGSVVAGDWLDTVCDVVIRFTNGTTSLLVQGFNTVQNTTSESMASFVSWTLQIGTGIRDHISNLVSSLSFKDLCRLTFILFLLVLLLTALWLARSYAQHIDMVNKRVASLAEGDFSLLHLLNSTYL
nr:uncharacterized protein LOC117684226 [Crassostrea gigas]